jgi:hypothetical protein
MPRRGKVFRPISGSATSVTTMTCACAVEPGFVLDPAKVKAPEIEALHLTEPLTVLSVTPRAVQPCRIEVSYGEGKKATLTLDRFDYVSTMPRPIGQATP